MVKPVGATGDKAPTHPALRQELRYLVDEMEIPREQVAKLLQRYFASLALRDPAAASAWAAGLAEAGRLTWDRVAELALALAGLAAVIDAEEDYQQLFAYLMGERPLQSDWPVQVVGLLVLAFEEECGQGSDDAVLLARRTHLQSFLAGAEVLPG